MDITQFFIADWLIDTRSNSISRGNEIIRIEPKAMRVLSLLAEKSGQVVTRIELEEKVWTDSVVGPDAITNTIIKLRRSLGDDAKDPTIIETIHKTGYRLLAPVRPAQPGDSELPLEHRLSAILYADVAGYSRLTGENEERTYREVTSALDQFAETIQRHNGTVVNYAGDAILAEFPTVSDAISCAVEVQRDNHDQGSGSEEDDRIRFRIGINLGEVIVARDDIYGDGVNIAARLEGLADIGGICISESAKSAIGNKLPLDYEFMGEQNVKNINEPIRAYRVLFYPGMKGSRQYALSKRPKLYIALAVLLLFLGAAAWTYLQQVEPTSSNPVVQTPEKPSIAVLPFANVSVDVEDEYFADGITDDIITDLAKVSGLHVISRSSVFTYKNKAINVQEIQRELGSKYIIEGSVRRSNDRIRINVQLVDASTGLQLWADRYDRQLDEIFQLQDLVINQVVNAVSVTLTDTETTQISRPPTNNLQAYDYYLRAQQTGYIGATFNLNETIALYQKAIELDPNFADAHSALSRLAVEAWRSDLSNEILGAAARDLAYRSASRALEIDPKNSQAYSVLAVIQLGEGQHDAAIRSARQAVSLGVNDTQAHLDLALVLAYSGDSAGALAEIDTAFSLNPKPTPDIMLYAGIVYFIDGQYPKAIEMLTKAQQGKLIPPTLLEFLAAAYGLEKQPQEAAQTITLLIAYWPEINLEYYRTRDVYFKRKDVLETMLEGLTIAGLPQWPYGFDPSALDHLEGTELDDLLKNQTWVGKHFRGADFIQEITESGSFAYRSQNAIQTGKVHARAGMLCQQLDGITITRDWCGYVYRNPDGSDETRDSFIAVLPNSLRYFSVNP